MVTSGEKTEESKIVISHTPTAFTEEVSNTSQDRQDFRKQTLWPCHEKPEGCLHLLFYSYFCSITALPCASAPMAHCQTPRHPQGSRNLSTWIGTPSSESRSTEPRHMSLAMLTHGLLAISGPRAPQPSEVWAVKPQQALWVSEACNVARTCRVLTSTKKIPCSGGQTSCTMLYEFCSEGLWRVEERGKMPCL